MTDDELQAAASLLDEREVAYKLLAHAREFIKAQRIRCPETVYQTDRVIENAYAFIEGVGDIVGWYQDPDDA